jgi:hypothetical protein
MTCSHRPRRIREPAMIAAAILIAGASVASAAPPIRATASNPVPACATPERLMAFLGSHNNQLDPRFRDIAAWYKKHGEAWRVRWDYAFFQMAIETNFLSYRRPGGRAGDVVSKQNNFAGIGTTGGGVPGDNYPDVGTGVLAQIQHLVVYSGERVANPVAARTRLKQDHILAWTQRLSKKRPVTFQDLAGKWAVDRRYGKSIDAIAARFQNSYCRGRQNVAVVRGPARSGPVPAATPGTEPPPPPLVPSRVRARNPQHSSLGVDGATVDLPRNAPQASEPATTASTRRTASYGGTTRS